MSKIKLVQGREILSSGSSPTIEAWVELESGAFGEASVPFGASAGSHEAFVLMDKDATRYNGKGMLKAANNINSSIASAIKGMEAEDQRAIDDAMIRLDGTSNKSNLGGNAILAVSLAVARAQAIEEKKPLYAYIRKAFNLPFSDYVLPNPMVVVIEGGKHADETTDLQEFIISTYGFDSAAENIRMAIEIYEELRGVLKRHGLSTNVGSEGAFAPNGIRSNELPFSLILEAIEKTKYSAGDDVGISIDAAASEFFENGKYNLAVENRILTSMELVDYYVDWMNKYPIVTIEDMLHEDDWEYWPILTEKASKKNVINIGDDLTVTNPRRLQKAIDTKSVTGLLVKLNQIGSLSETIDASMMAVDHNIMIAPSHRGGGETEDTMMVDLAVALNAAFIKVGPTRGERVSKYNRLTRIEGELKGKCTVIGKDFRRLSLKAL